MTDATVDVSTLSVNVSQRGTGLATRSLTEGGVSGIEKGEVAVSFAPFEQPQTIAITIPNSPQQVSFDAHYVSRNYFEVLKVTTLAGDDAWQSGVRINQAAADILGSTASGTDLIGKSINIGSIYGQPQVTGIVDNLPHRGRASAGAPMIYFSVEASAHTPQRSTFFFNDANKTRVSQALTTWLNQEMIDPVLSDPLSIAEVLAREDQAVNSLFASTVLISALIIASVLISLGYQIKARLRVDRHEYGVLLAIGAPPQSLLLRVLRHTFIAFAVAVPLAVFVLAVATSKLQAGSALPVSFVPLVFILACFVTLLLTIVTASVPLRRILREPIFSYLRQG